MAGWMGSGHNLATFRNAKGGTWGPGSKSPERVLGCKVKFHWKWRLFIGESGLGEM